MRARSCSPAGLPRAAVAVLLTLSAACGGGGAEPPSCVPSSEICDGVDEDCDGLVDEDFDAGAACTVGVGACQASGQRVCSADRLATVCDAVPGGPAAEVCNGIDDDCDGVVDQGDPGGGGACSTGLPGVCASGVLHCAAGALACEPSAAPSSEVCNGLDDDCDGQVDEGFDAGGACTVGVGACLASGVRICSTDHLGTICDAVAGSPSVEVCNGIDDDCDGAIDQGDPGGGAACSTGLVGACAVGIQHCTAGSIQCAQSVLGSAETCNGLDDDCDGAVDEGDPGGGGACSTGLAGVCAAGVQHCTAGALQCVQSALPSAEVCNGVDDDCDGAVDQGDPGGGAACSTGLAGVCAAGVRRCAGGALTCAQSVAASAEACNGLDDDCNGQVDEGDPGGGGACSTGLLGVCAAGVVQCTSGALACVQLTAAAPETCNGKDDDCNGVVDEGFGVGASCSAGIGACARTGSIVCDAGGSSSSCNAVAGTPVTEVCGNGLDDDCDGTVDEGCPYSHTITMDGYNDFVAATERFGTTSAGYTAYVTWDAAYLYVGYSGADIGVGGSHNWILLYFDVRSGTAGLPMGCTYGTQTVLFPVGFTGDAEMGTRADGMSDVHWAQGVAWVTSGISVVNYSRRDTYIEMRIPFSALGDPATLGVIALLVDDRAGSEWTYAGLYPDAFTDGYDRAVNHYLLVDRTSTAAPNAPENER